MNDHTLVADPRPPRSATALELARRYHDRWTGQDPTGVAPLLADDLTVEVPINAYPDAAAFAAAVHRFGALARRVELLSACAAGNEAMLLYDMDVEGLGDLRVAEHFTVADGKIIRIRQIHDTTALRAAGFAGDGAGPGPGDTRRTLEIAAPVERVYAALTTPAGLRGWWSARADVATEVGGLTRFAWSDTDHTTFRVDRLDPCAEVVWTCVAQHDGNLPDPQEWVGTTVAFRLAPAGDGTMLEFTHRGLAELECGDLCAGGWDFFLRQSLKPLVETGRGRPWRA